MIKISGYKVHSGQFTKITLDSWGNIVEASFPETLDEYHIKDAVKNIKDTPAVLTDALMNRPIPNILNVGHLFISNDTNEIYRSDGSAWYLLGIFVVDGGFY